MTSGRQITDEQRRQVLRLLRRAHQSGRPSKSQIAKAVELNRKTVSEIIETAAILWLELIEAQERLANWESKAN